MTLPVRPSDLTDVAPLTYAPERRRDAAAVAALVTRAFGPGRYAKTAERLREGSTPRADLSFCAHAGDVLVGTVRLWPVWVGEEPEVFLGPIAVERSWRRHGVGAALVQHACCAAEAAGERRVVLVGEMSFFGPLGFECVPSGAAVLPGPVDPARVLWRRLG